MLLFDLMDAVLVTRRWLFVLVYRYLQYLGQRWSEVFHKALEDSSPGKNCAVVYQNNFLKPEQIVLAEIHTKTARA